MNKIIYLAILLCLPLRAEPLPWYSELDKNVLLKNNADFFSKNEIKHQNLIKTLQLFKTFLLNRDSENLYKQRSPEYREVVPFENFKTNIIDVREMPVRIYFSDKRSVITKDHAAITAFYVINNGKFETCDETVDEWRFDAKQSQWIFIKNTLGWGSPVVIK